MDEKERLEREQLWKKRSQIREACRSIATMKDLDLYFANRQRYNELKAIFVNQSTNSYHSIIVLVDEVEDINQVFDSIKHYLENNTGHYFNGELTVSNKDENSLYPKVIHEYFMTGRGYGKSAFLDYYKNDMSATRELYGIFKDSQRFKIENVIFNDPATIVFWADGSKTVVKCQEGDVFDKEKGLAMAISKRALGDKGRYCNEFKKWIPEIEEAKVETEVFFDDSNLRIALEKAGKTFNEAANRIISAVHESNRIDKCSGCVNFDQNTEVKRRHCARCNDYDEFIRRV